MHMLHAWPGFLDDARALVPEHGRDRMDVHALRRVEVGAADAAADKANEHLAVARRVELDLLDDERGSELVQDGRAHGPRRVCEP
jgi:hypothetical protein